MSVTDPSDLQEDDAEVNQDRLWIANGWTARVIKNEDDDGWAVAMTLKGQQEPALVGPWTMGRDKKNPKPLDSAAFRTLVKTAAEVVRRHEQQEHARLHKSVSIDATEPDPASGRLRRITVSLDIVPDEFEPYATLTADDEYGERLAEARVSASFRLSNASASAWIDSDFAPPRR